MDYGCLNYDVPIAERAVYNRLRKRVRRIGIPLTSSCLLVPWGARESIKTILDEVQSEKPNIINSSIIKFDASEESQLAAQAEKGLNLILKNTHKTMMDRLSKAETEHKEASTKINEVLQQKNRKTTDAELFRLREITDDQLEIEAKKALVLAERALKDATALSVLFNMTNQFEFAIAEFQKLIDSRRESLKAKNIAEELATVVK